MSAASPARCVWLAAVAVMSAVVVGLTGCATAPAPAQPTSGADATYGSLPSYLPKSSMTPDRALVGSIAHPALTVEGDTVIAQLGEGASVSATVVGPVVPGEGLPNQPAATTTTFTVTFAGATRTVALSLDQFRITDHLGATYALMPVPGQPPVPSEIGPGQTVSFEVRTVMVTGEGLLQWAPDLSRPVASWDFVAEID